MKEGSFHRKLWSLNNSKRFLGEASILWLRHKGSINKLVNCGFLTEASQLRLLDGGILIEYSI